MASHRPAITLAACAVWLDAARPLIRPLEAGPAVVRRPSGRACDRDGWTNEAGNTSHRHQADSSQDRETPDRMPAIVHDPGPPLRLPSKVAASPPGAHVTEPFAGSRSHERNVPGILPCALARQRADGPLWRALHGHGRFATKIRATRVQSHYIGQRSVYRLTSALLLPWSLRRMDARDTATIIAARL